MDKNSKRTGIIMLAASILLVIAAGIYHKYDNVNKAENKEKITRAHEAYVKAVECGYQERFEREFPKVGSLYNIEGKLPVLEVREVSCEITTEETTENMEGADWRVWTDYFSWELTVDASLNDLEDEMIWEILRAAYETSDELVVDIALEEADTFRMITADDTTMLDKYRFRHETEGTLIVTSGGHIYEYTKQVGGIYCYSIDGAEHRIDRQTLTYEIDTDEKYLPDSDEKYLPDSDEKYGKQIFGSGITDEPNKEEEC